MVKKLSTNSNGYILNARITGSGPVLVMLHGFLASSQYWERTRTLLSDEYTVVALDLLGFGKSPKPYLSRYDYKAQLESIHMTLEKHGIHKPFSLVGHSMGSLIALRYANTYPEQVSKLLLANMPIMLTPTQVESEIYSSKVARLGLHPIAQYVMWGVFKSIATLRLLPGTVKRNLDERLAYVFQHSGVSRVRSFRSLIVNGDVAHDLQRVPMATTLLSGLQDRAIYMQNLATMALPSLVDLRVVDSTHHIPILMPELIAETIRTSRR